MTPAILPVDSELRLRPYAGDEDVDLAWPWYRDAETVALVDGEGAAVYTRDRVAEMYAALQAQGEVYLIERRTPEGAWEAVGDVTLAPDTIPIVVAPGCRRQGIAGGFCCVSWTAPGCSTGRRSTCVRCTPATRRPTASSPGSGSCRVPSRRR